MATTSSQSENKGGALSRLKSIFSSKKTGQNQDASAQASAASAAQNQASEPSQPPPAGG